MNQAKPCCLALLVISGLVAIFSMGCLVLAALAPSQSAARSTPEQTSIQARLTRDLNAEQGLHFYSAKIEGDSLIIRARLDRDTLETFYTDIGLIHGIVVRLQPPVERVIIHDLTGQKIEMPMQAMIDYYYERIGWDEFMGTWTVMAD